MADVEGAREKEGAGGTAIEGGAYEIIRARLEQGAKLLADKASALNARRIELFGGTSLEVLANERIRTEHNCVPVDIVEVGGRLLFGYTVFLGLKRETKVDDVFSVQRFDDVEGAFAFEAIPSASVPWLCDPRFVKDFTDLYQYYQGARLVHLVKTETGRVLAVFQTGESLRDVKVLRWATSPAGDVEYIDNRGDDDYRFPPLHDFAWRETTRDDFSRGRHPHVNVLDEVFVETVGGDLTVKIEDNTDSGQGIYSEPVDDLNQGLDDAQIHYAKLGALILLKVRPYREEAWRYLVFNTRTHSVVRIDQIGTSCVQLPEDHGVIFPGGYYLQDGEHKTFDVDTAGMQLLRAVRSPNGEDVLYVFYERAHGRAVLLSYNLIDKEVKSPIYAHGWCLFDNGHLVVFRADEEPTRVHHMRVWKTPFMSAERAAALTASSSHAGSLFAKVGNAELVRGISEVGSLRRQIVNQTPAMKVYEDLVASCTRTLDSYPWLSHAEVGNLAATLAEVRQTAELVIDELEKVLAIKRAAAEALDGAVVEQQRLFTELRPDTWRTVDHFIDAMAALRRQRGQLITLRDMRYIDVAHIDELEAAVSARFDELAKAAVQFLARADALAPYRAAHGEVTKKIEAVHKTPEAAPLFAELNRLSTGLDLLTEVVAGLAIDDPEARTRVLEDIGEVFALTNRARATLEARRKELARMEGTAAFGAQFKLFAQSAESALSLCDTPERCDEQLTRLLVQLEELEGRFADLDEFLARLGEKREEVYEAFAAKRQGLVEVRQRRAQGLVAAAERILAGVKRRALAMAEASELNAYFAADPMVMKVRDLAAQLRALGDTVKADELEGRIKATRDEAARQLRDKSELYEGGDDVIKLGNHRFSVNKEPLDLTLLPRDGKLALHLAGTDFFETVTDPRLDELKAYWEQALPSESAVVYRGEYLAASILLDADDPRTTTSLGALQEAAKSDGGVLAVVRQAISARYDEGYERGVHDHDAALLLEKLLWLHAAAGTLRFSPRARALAQLFWASFDDEKQKGRLAHKAQSFARLERSLGRSSARRAFADEIARAVTTFAEGVALACSSDEAAMAGAYLLDELAAERPRFTTSAEADKLKARFLQVLDDKGARVAFEGDLLALGDDVGEAWALCRAWLEAFLAEARDEATAALAPALDEAVALLVCGARVDREVSAAQASVVVEGLLGVHPRIAAGKLALRLDEVLVRLSRHMREVVPGYRRFRAARHDVLEEARARMRLDELKPRVLSSFVRNKLINDVYLPFIGDNLAKQMGAVGAKKRTDLMGMLLLVSPPGYGKTTLMEYVASRLGVVFLKVNGPSLGHEVTSLDPEEAPNATARQEVERINLAFEMGNNVMLYLDDIQHTNPELLQKFISLCDGSRRIEGVWKKQTRTYDLRGKKLVVVMAGNPYTESGEKFKIPDMLANRADTYNLGEILGGKEAAFALSYLENALTSNAVLQPLAAREQSDTYLFFKMAEGEEVNTTDLKHNYSAVEIDEIVGVLRRLFVCRDVLLKVNAEYIRSASMDDRYRTEPPFKLQGSYRNMNKLAEKVVAVMNDAELLRVIDDHYQAEAQTLTTGAEQNLLKLAELRGRMTAEQRARWDEIKRTFQRNQLVGGKDEDPVVRVTSTLTGLGQKLEDIGSVVASASREASESRRHEHADGVVEARALAGELKALRAALVEASQGARSGKESEARSTTKALAELGQAIERAATGAQGAARESLTALLARMDDERSGGAERLLQLLARVDASLAALANARVDVNVTAPPPRGLEQAMALQQSLVEGTLVPLLEAMRALLARPLASPPVAVEEPAKRKGKKRELELPLADGALGALPQQIGEALALLRELKAVVEHGESSSSKSYRPFKRDPVGTRVEDD